MFSTGMKLMLAAVLFFQGTNISVKQLSHIPFTEVVVFRALFSLIACAVILKWQRKSLIGHNKKLLLARGVAGTIGLTLFFYTVHNMPLGTAVALQYLAPILTILLAGWLVGEPVRKAQWLFFALAILGTFLVKGVDERVSLFELSIGLLAALASAFAYNFIRKLRHTDEPLVVVFYFPLVTVPLIGPFAIKDWVQPVGNDWFWVFGVGAFTFVAQVLMTKAMQMEKAEYTGMVRYIGVAVAVLIGYLVYGETLDVMSLSGIGCIMLAIVISTIYRRRMDKLEGVVRG